MANHFFNDSLFSSIIVVSRVVVTSPRLIKVTAHFSYLPLPVSSSSLFSCRLFSSTLSFPPSPFLSSLPSLAVIYLPCHLPISDPLTAPHSSTFSISFLHLLFEVGSSGWVTDLLKTFNSKGLEATTPTVRF